MSWWPARRFSVTAKVWRPKWNACVLRSSKQRIYEGKEHDNATRHDRPRTDGRQHGAATHQEWPPMRGLRPVGRGGERPREREGGWRVVARRSRQETAEAPRRLADGPGRGRGQKHR